MATLRIGNILGESTLPGYEREVDVRTWSWQVARPDEANERPVVGDLVIVKGVDKASPELVKLACSGHVVPEAVLTVPRKGGWADLVALRIRLSGVRVRSASFNGVNSDLPLETVSLGFDEFTIEYIEQTITGGHGATTFTSWRITDDLAAAPEMSEETW